MPNYYHPDSEQALNEHNQQESMIYEDGDLNLKYDDGSPVKIGDTVHCYDTDGTINPIITQSLKGVVGEVGGKLCVNGNDLALTCAMHVDKIAV